MEDRLKLLGFDAREMQLDDKGAWGHERRKMYLLRRDTDKPLSTDPMVWPSIITAEDRQRIAHYQVPADLVTDLARLCEYLKLHADKLAQPYWTIGVAVLLDHISQQKAQPWGSFSIPTVPADRNPQWTLLGYDVSDRWLLSGLSNCGYIQPGESEAVSQQFGKHLNEHHLFIESDSAIEFKALSNSRVREHAPFFVFGLYRIDTG